jgi:predicted metalloprotease with PDZ domain
MKRLTLLSAIAVICAVAVTGFAGDKECCKASTQECLDKMVAKYQQKGWLGVETEKTAGGRWAIKKVFKGSPAEAAGFKPGDVFVSVNGVDMSKGNKEALMKAKHTMTVGSKASYVVKRQGGKLKLDVELGSVPNEVIAEWIGEHLIHDHAGAKMASK